MNEPEDKTCRIYLKPGTQRKFLELTGEELMLETERLDQGWGGQSISYNQAREGYENATPIFPLYLGRTAVPLPEDLVYPCELDLEKYEEDSFLILFNGVPKICLFHKFIPEKYPNSEVFALVRYGRDQEVEENEFSFEYLANWTNLTSLDLSRWHSLPNLDGLSSLINLKSLNLESCGSLKNLNGLKGLSNITSLDLNSCIRLTNLVGLSGLDKLLELELFNCASLRNVDGLKGLSSLRSLEIKGCDEIENLNGFKGLRNLESLDLIARYRLKDLQGLRALENLKELKLFCWSDFDHDLLSGLTNLTKLNLSGCRNFDKLDVRRMTRLRSLKLANCKSLKEVVGLSELTGLTSLDFENCESLIGLEGLSELTSLTSLNLENCETVTNLDVLSGLTNLTSLNLRGRGRSLLTNVDGLSELTKLQSLNLRGCSSLTNIDGLNTCGILSDLDLSNCSSLTSLDGLEKSKNLRILDLECCSSLSSVEQLQGLGMLSVLKLKRCPYLKKINKLKNCSNLRELEFYDPVEVARVLSQTGREDEGFVKDMAQEWLEVARKAPEPDELVCDLSDTFGLYAKESWASDALSQLMDLMLVREEVEEITWASLLGATAGCPKDSVREILERIADDMNQERASSVLRPLLKTLADLPESLSEWANERADELLDSLDIDFLRDYGPSVCLFYARMGREDRLRSWLEKLTDPETPRWRDRIHLALGQWEIARVDLNSPRARLKEMSQGSFKDELLETLARALAKEKPLEAGELLDQISEEWRQATLSAELSEEAAFTEPADNAYRLLLHMERDPDKLADWVATLTRNHPDSELVKEVARTFGSHETVNALPQLLSDLLEEEVIVKATKENQLKSFKEELMAEGEPQSFLLETLVGRMCKRGLVNEEEAKQLLENLKGKQL